MRLKDLLVPNDRRFFDLLTKQVVHAKSAADRLVALLADYKDLPATRKAVKEIEHQGDLVTHALFTELNATFVTPLDREDLARLASALDDILDRTWGVVNRLHLYEISTPPRGLHDIAKMLQGQLVHLEGAIAHLHDPKRRKEVQDHLVEVHRLENLADETTDREIVELFHQDDVKTILKHRDIYDMLEVATDKCEDVADVIRDILVKHG